jgi:hypothetical protein
MNTVLAKGEPTQSCSRRRTLRLTLCRSSGTWASCRVPTQSSSVAKPQTSVNPDVVDATRSRMASAEWRLLLRAARTK